MLTVTFNHYFSEEFTGIIPITYYHFNVPYDFFYVFCEQYTPSKEDATVVSLGEESALH